MRKKSIWLVISSLMLLLLIFTACGPSASTGTTTTPTSTPTTPTSSPTAPTSAPTNPTEAPIQEPIVSNDTPKYGGILNRVMNSDLTDFDSIAGPTGSATKDLTQQSLWAGDWTKGPAGGYGTDETDWADNYDVWEDKTGYVAENVEWSIDVENSQGTIVYTIRQGINWALNPNSEASLLVGGRELTADDVVHTLKRATASPDAYFYRANPELRDAEVTKTGPLEVSVKLSLDALPTGIFRLGDATGIQPPEVIEKYGSMSDWKTSVGTGPFILKDYVPGSTAILARNDDYWMKDPIGPGEGNQLPYLDGVTWLIIPDASTRQAALRTGKIDQMEGVNLEDSAVIRQTTRGIMEIQGRVTTPSGFPRAIHMRADKPPFDDVRVRQAIMLATDFSSINQNLFDGTWLVQTFPFERSKGYATLHLGLDDPDMPEDVKELYSFDPDKAKQLMIDAGYPDGFKTEALITSAYVDYYSILKDMWSKIGIDLELNVRESGAKSAIMRNSEYEGMTDGGRGPVSIFYSLPSLRGTPGGAVNMSHINDSVITEGLERVREIVITQGLQAGMQEMRTLMPHILRQVYAIPGPYVPTYVFWWPWVKNYTGEISVGYFDSSWPQWIWYDKELKKEMGY